MFCKSFALARSPLLEGLQQSEAGDRIAEDLFFTSVDNKMAVIFSVSQIVAQGISSYPATLIEFEVEGGVMSPSDLATLAFPDVDGSKGVILSGRGPVWLYAALAHNYHVTRWVATFDPRVVEGGGAVVVSVHSLDAPAVGSVVSLPKPE